MIVSARQSSDVADPASQSAICYQLFLVRSWGTLRRNGAQLGLETPCLPGHPVIRLEGQDLADSSDAALRDTADIRVSVIGQIWAGDPNLAERVADDTFLLPRHIVGRGPLFMLKVVGDSMINAAITDGNWVVVHQQPEAEEGEIVVALVEGEATVKVFQQIEGHVWLVPQNSRYTSIAGDKATILGKVVAVVRQVS
jgi:repressor LexA